MLERGGPDGAMLHQYLEAGDSRDLLQALLEYMAREQDHAAQHALVRQLLARYVALTHELQGHIAQIERQKQQLERLNAQKNELLGIAAHDLRNPLSAVQVYSELLLRMLNENLDDKQQDFLERIHQSSLFMTQLIDDLLDVSKIESGTLTLEKVLVDYRLLVEQNARTNAVLAEKKQITLAVRCAADLPSAWLDPPKIEQVLNNLLSNAIKYSHPHTTIILRVFQRGDQLVTEVDDQGQGIPADELPHIFETFHKSSVQTTGGEKSTGLGLAIAKKIIEGHGGTISVRSQVGHGSNFAFELPAAAHSESEER